MKEDDIHTVTKLIELTKQSDLMIVKTAKRIGDKKEGEKRLVKLVLANKQQRDIFIHDMRVLKKQREGWSKEGGGLDHLTFSIDRTYEERQEFKKLKKELEFRVANGETNIKINSRGDRIVKIRQPFRGDPQQGGEQY